MKVVIAGKLGKSLAVCIPPEIANKLQVTEGTRFQVSCVNGRIVFEPMIPDMLQIMATAPAWPEVKS